MTDDESPPSLDTMLGRTTKSRVPRWAVWCCVAIGVVLLVLLGMRLFDGRAEQPDYETATVRRGDLVVAVTATGNLQPTRQVEVGSETSGLVVEVLVDNNDQVVKGQPLARLDTARLRDALTEAAASETSAEKQVLSAEASVRQSRAQFARLDDVYRISGGKIPSKTELDQGRADLDRAQAQVGVNRAQVVQANAQVGTARTNLARATIYSPVKGIVLSRKIDPGQTVAAQFQTPILFTIAQDLSQMRLDVKVDEADIAQVHARQSAKFMVDAFPGLTFPAIVERVDKGANATHSGSGSGSSSSSSGGSAAATSNVISYTARLLVSNEDDRLNPGMTAVARIEARRIRNRLIVPLSALRFAPPQPKAAKGLSVQPPSQEEPSVRETRIGRGSRQTVYVTDDKGVLTAIPVMTIAVAGRDVAIESQRLKPGMRVVTGLLIPAP